MFVHKSYGISILLFDQIPDFFKKSLCLNNIFLFFHTFTTFAPLLGSPGLRSILACASMLQLGFPLVPSWLRLALSWANLGYLVPSLPLIGPLLRSPGLSWALLGRLWPPAGLSSGSTSRHIGRAWRYLGATWCNSGRTWLNLAATWPNLA